MAGGARWREGHGKVEAEPGGRRSGAWSHSQAQPPGGATHRARTRALCRERASLWSQATLCGHLWQPQDTHTLPSEARLPPSSRSRAAVPTFTHPQLLSLAKCFGSQSKWPQSGQTRLTPRVPPDPALAM